MGRRITACTYPIKGAQAIATLLYENEKAAEISLAKQEESQLLGSIFVGKIEKIDPGLSAAFVQIGKDLKGYLPVPKERMTGKRDCWKAGDELLVQVEKEAIKQKLPRLTTNLNLTGRYMVFTSEHKGVNFSRRLAAFQKAELTEKLHTAGIRMENCTYGVIIRTNAAEAPENALAAEWEQLEKEMDRILSTGKSRTCFSCLYTEEREWIRMLRQCAFTDLERIVTDNDAVFTDFENYLRERAAEDSVREISAKDRRPGYGRSIEFGMPEGGSIRLELYTDKLVSLYQVCSLTTLLDTLTGNQVWLKSGGSIVVEQTEAFTAIDVNTGRVVSRLPRQELAYKINMEAAAEAARQIRLRQLSGTILIDFINMQDPSREKELGEFLQTKLSGDPAGAKVVDFTALHICEITRKKQVRSLKEQIGHILSEDITQGIS